MGLGRRKVQLDDASAWVFNRMADVYDARPPYPAALVDAVSALAGSGRVVDLGAGIGHLAVPLAQRGLQVSAVEPAIAMLERLRERAGAQPIEMLHAQAERVPLPDGSCSLALIADGLHFMDAELVGREVRRLLAPAGALALIGCELDDTPFMNALTQLMHDAAPRRPRETAGAAMQLASVAGVALGAPHVFRDATPLSAEQLERVLRSISFIGPAMNAQRFEAFRGRVHALPEPVWARRFVLQVGR